MNVAKITSDEESLSDDIHERTFFLVQDQIDDIYKKINKINNLLKPRYVIGQIIKPITDEAVSRAKLLYRERRIRDKLLDNDLFGEPSWDILLDLVIQAGEGKTVSVTSACIASTVPPTTALRWLSVLEKRGLIIRTDNDKDARSTYVNLSEMGQKLMNDYLVGA